MGSRTHKLELKDKTYTIVSVPATVGAPMAQELLRLFGPTIVTFLEAKKGTKLSDMLAGGDAEKLIDQIGPALIDRLVSGLSDPTLFSIVRKLLEEATCTMKVGKEHKEFSIGGDVFDEHFAENYGELVQLAWFSIERNFQSFFGTGLGSALFRSKKEKSPEKSNLQPVSTDGSQPSLESVPS